MVVSINTDESKTQKIHESHIQICFLYITSVLKEAEVSTKCKLEILLCYKIIKHAI